MSRSGELNLQFAYCLSLGIVQSHLFVVRDRQIPNKPSKQVKIRRS